MDPSEDYLRQLRWIEAWQRMAADHRRAAEALRVAQAEEPIRQLIEEERRRFAAVTAYELAGQIDRARQLAAQRELVIDHASRRAVEQYRSILEHAASPYPHLMVDTLRQQEGWLRSYNEMNRALRDAPFWADVELSGEDGDDREQVESAVEGQLIEVVPAEALDELRRIRFAPFTLLAEAMTRPEALMDLSPRAFERFVAELSSRLGLEDVQLTAATSDGGRDVVGTLRVGSVSLIIALECKRYRRDRAVGVAFARALLGTIHHPDTRSDRGILVTTSRFSTPAHRFIVTAPQLHGVAFNGIVDWLREASIGGRLMLPTTR